MFVKSIEDVEALYLDTNQEEVDSFNRQDPRNPA